MKSNNKPRPTRDDASSSFDPWILWVTLRRSWYWAAPVGAVLASVAGLFVLKSFVPRYRASHLLEANTDYVVFKGVMPMIDDLAKTERPLFYNPIVLDPVLSDPEIRQADSLSDPDTAEANLRKSLTIKSAGSKSQLLVEYEENDREMAAMVCNAVVNAYLRQRDAFDTTRVSNLERWLEPEIQRWQAEVEKRQSRVQLLSERTLGYNPAARVSVAEDESSFALFAELRSQITEIEVQLSVWDATKAMEGELSDSVAAVSPAQTVGEVPFVPVRREVVLSPVLDSEVDRLAQSDAKVAEAKQKYGHYENQRLQMEASDLIRINRGHYQRLVDDRDRWEKKIAEALKQARVVIRAELEAQAQKDYERRIAAAEADVERQRKEFLAELERTKLKHMAMRQGTMKAERDSSLQRRVEAEARLAVLRKQYDEERVRLERLGGDSAELQFATDELAVASGVLTKLRDRVAAIRTERRQDGAVRSLAIATPPRHPSRVSPPRK